MGNSSSIAISLKGPKTFITFNVLMGAHREVRKAILAWLDERISFRSQAFET